MFTPKEGGTVLGNALRKLVYEYSDGNYGTGNMKLRPGETVEQYKLRISKSLGAAAEAFNQSNQQTMLEKFKQGVVGQKLMQIAPLALIALGAYVIFKPKFGKSKSRKRTY